MTQPRPDTDPGFLAFKLLEAVEEAPAIDEATLKEALRKIRRALRRKAS